MKPQREGSSNSPTCWVLFLVVSTIVVRVVMVVVLDSDVSVARLGVIHGIGFKGTHIHGLFTEGEFILDGYSIHRRGICLLGLFGNAIVRTRAPVSDVGDAHGLIVALALSFEDSGSKVMIYDGGFCVFERED
jgi:hypothetical protein